MSRNNAKLSILNELLSFPTVRGKDWTSDCFREYQPQIGDLVSMSSAPPSKWYVSWIRDYDPNNGWPKYLLESIEDQSLCWWENVGINVYSRERVKENPQWQWNDRQYALESRWCKVCKKNEVYPIRPCQPKFNQNGSVELNVRVHIFFESDFHNPKIFPNYKKLTLREMTSYYLDCVEKYKEATDDQRNEEVTDELFGGMLAC